MIKRSVLTRRGIIVVSAAAVTMAAVGGYYVGASTIPTQPPAVRTVVVKQPTPGSVIAYYENEYQRTAINVLTRQGKVEQWPCLWALWTAESNWRPTALNHDSGAYGIAQFMPFTWEGVGVKRTSNGHKQVKAGLKYIGSRYGGSPCKAYAHYLARKWY